MARLTLRGLSKRFGPAAAAVDGLSLDIADGELVTIVGPSGSGKTTTLRLIAGFERPDSGSILLDDRDITRLSPRERSLAMVFPDAALMPNLTVAENLVFGERLREPLGATGLWLARRLGLDMAKNTDRRRRESDFAMRAIASELRIEELLERFPHQLSDGQRRRVAIGKALMRKPNLFLLDEPLAHLDGPLRLELRDLLRRISRQTGATMLLVTHDQEEAMALGTKLAVLDRGRLRQIDAPLAVYRQPADAFVAGFLGSPPMNLIPGSLVTRDGQVWFHGDEESIRVPLGDRSDPNEIGGGALPVLLGIRPENLDLSESIAASGPASAGLGPARIATRVEAIEPRGGSTVFVLSAGAQSLRAVSAENTISGSWPTLSAAVGVLFPIESVHLFDRGGAAIA